METNSVLLPRLFKHTQRGALRTFELSARQAPLFGLPLTTRSNSRSHGSNSQSNSRDQLLASNDLRKINKELDPFVPVDDMESEYASIARLYCIRLYNLNEPLPPPPPSRSPFQRVPSSKPAPLQLRPWVYRGFPGWRYRYFVENYISRRPSGNNFKEQLTRTDP